MNGNEGQTGKSMHRTKRTNETCQGPTNPEDILCILGGCTTGDLGFCQG